MSRGFLDMRIFWGYMVISMMRRGSSWFWSLRVKVNCTSNWVGYTGSVRNVHHVWVFSLSLSLRFANKTKLQFVFSSSNPHSTSHKWPTPSFTSMRNTSFTETSNLRTSWSESTENWKLEISDGPFTLRATVVRRCVERWITYLLKWSSRRSTRMR